ncbi:MAM and LDL-receptor class A domain-containing protein 1-like [Tachypleus tridentatus]|uniref:MAM and LDL-receptor class A domain-containing protein 1-like n=1 Tax=Tachypleus tridentatus TaxID=6853 RepID=UPI003FD62A19
MGERISLAFVFLLVLGSRTGFSDQVTSVDLNRENGRTAPTESPVSYFCDFEDGMCDWKNDDINKNMNWEIGRGPTLTPYTGPSVDHTVGTGNGSYLYINASSGKDETARLLGPFLTSRYCLHFWYHMYGSHVGSLTVFIQQGLGETAVFQKYKNQGDQWKQAVVTLNSQENDGNTYRVVIAAIHHWRTQKEGDIALDDISLSLGECEGNQGDPLHICTFDNNHDCGYSPNTSTWTWAHKKTDSKLPYGVPEEDHTLGTQTGGHFYFYTRLSNGENATLHSPVYSAGSTGQRCVKFFYYFNAHYAVDAVLRLHIVEENSVGELNVTDIWSKSKSQVQFKQWLYAVAPFVPSQQYQIRFQGNIVADSSTSIAIDDVVVSDGICPEAGFCNFEDNLCFWTHGPGSFNWLRRTSGTYNDNGPKKDHTKSSDSGYYLHIDAYGKTPGSFARLESLTFTSASNSKRSMEFWYQLYGTGVKALRVIQKQSEGMEEVLWHLDGIKTKIKTWSKAMVPLMTSEENYQIILEGLVYDGSQGDVAVDDIKFYFNFLSDLVPEDADPQSALLSYVCDFEKDMCVWRNVDSQSKLQWQRGKGETATNYTGPSEDHTKGDEDGYYVYVDVSSAGKSVGKMWGPVLKETYCLHFWYHMFGAHVGSLSVILQSVQNPNMEIEIFKKKRNQNIWWKEMVVTLSPEEDLRVGGYKVIFVANHNFITQMKGDIAIDDISIIGGNCSVNLDDPSLLCTFDMGVDCGYTSTSANESYAITWSLKEGGNEVSYGVPEIDHTLGSKYGGHMFLSAKFTGNDDVILQSPNYKGDGVKRNKCITFFYYFNARYSNKAVLKVFGKDSSEQYSELWSKTKTDVIFKKWLYAEIPYLTEGDFRIEFRGLLESDSSSPTLAIDDVKIVDGICTEAGFCDFEEHMCFWTDDGDFPWLRKKGSSHSEEDGPQIDHSTGTPYGFYVFINSHDTKSDHIARLQSEVFPPLNNESRCMIFWYHMYGDERRSLRVMVRTENQTEKTVWVLKGYHDKTWQKGRVSVVSRDESHQVVFEGNLKNGSKGFIAIDDIRFTSTEKCALVPKQADPSDDIENLLTCSFDDETLCYWSENNEQLSWKFGERSSAAEIFGPLKPVDGKGKYLYIPSLQDHSSTQIAVLESAVLPVFDEDICLTFWYHMFGPAVGELHVGIHNVTEQGLGREIAFWGTRGSQPDKWHQFAESIALPEGKYEILIKALPIKGFAGDIAIDEIKGSIGSCLHQEGHVCTFEFGMCEWNYGITSQEPNRFRWELKVADNNPKIDHTTDSSLGKVLQTVSEEDSLQDSIADIVSPMYDASQKVRCLSLWYYIINSVGDSSLEVFIRTDKKYEIMFKKWTRNFGHQWEYGQVDIFNSSSYQIVVRARMGKTGNTVITIDDVAVNSSACYPLGSCNFDNDLCGYTNNLNVDFNWLVGFGRVSNPTMISYPSPDSPSGEGMYAYVDLTSVQLKENNKAQLVSPVLNGAAFSCLRFWYFINGKGLGKLSVYRNLFSSENDSINNVEIWSRSFPEGSKWSSVALQVHSDDSFQLMFEVIRGTGTDAFVAVDDITYEERDCNSVVTASKIVSTTSPETHECDFDQGNTCMFKDVSTVADSWKINKLGTTLKNLPRFDHTKGNYKGHYTYVKGNNMRELAVLESPQIPGTWNDTCITFWFYVDTDGLDNLAVVSRNNSNVDTPLWLWSYSSGFRWLYAQLSLDSASVKKVRFVAEVTNGGVALDDIKIMSSSCPSQEICTFDSEDMCNYRQDPANYITWELKSGSVSDILFNIIDHTTKTSFGNFLYLNLEQAGKEGKEAGHLARIFSPVYEATEGSCVSFWYHMTGVMKESLNCYQYTSSGLSDPLWSTEGDLGLYWYGASFSVLSPKLPWQAAFEVILDGKRKAQVALDDIVVTEGFCPPPGFCDFEDDNCLWQNVHENGGFLYEDEEKKHVEMRVDDFDWQRHIAEDDMGPMGDHTLGSAEGFYMLLDPRKPRLSGQRAVLMSERLSVKESICLEFWYALPDVIDGATIQVYQSDVYGTAYFVSSWRNITNDKWQKAEITISPGDHKEGKYIWVYIVGTLGSDHTGYAAVDDIRVIPDACEPEVVEPFKCGMDQIVSQDAVCNFRIDCMNAADEENCSSCDFEHGQCGWEGVDTNVQGMDKWIRTDGNSEFGPQTDHTILSEKGYYVTAYFQENSNNEDDLMISGPRFQDSGATCLVSFWYNYKGPVTLDVEIEINERERIHVWTLSRKESLPDVWMEGQVYIGRVPPKARLYFRSSKSGSERQYVAVDDITMVDCGIPPPNLEGCSDTQFWCANKVCVDESHICDYTDDCGDQSDEQHCYEYHYRCNFDYSLCDWQHDVAGNARFTRRSGFQFLSEGPTRDHTRGLRFGGFLILEPDMNTNKIAKLAGPVFQPTENCKINFYYDVRGDIPIELRIKTRNFKDGQEKDVWVTKKGNEAYYFLREGVLFKERQNFQVIIEGIVGALKKGGKKYVAVDDISFSSDCIPELSPLPTAPPPTLPPLPEGCTVEDFLCKTNDQCVPQNQVCDFDHQCADGSDESECGECDFVNTMCGWTNVGTGIYRWDPVKASSFARFQEETTIPSVDSHGDPEGWFLVLDSENKGIFTSAARMTTPVLQEMSYSCSVEFAYHYNSYGGGIELRVVDPEKPKNYKTVFVVNINKGKLWQRVSVSLGPWPAGRVLELHGNAEREFLGLFPAKDIAIDDFKFKDCSPRSPASKSLNCTFEEDECGWYPENKDGTVEWLRGKGQSNFGVTGPSSDHTTGRGYYMYISRYEQFTKEGDKAYLVSSIQSPSEGRCLMFWYHMYGQGIGTLNVQFRSQNNPQTVWTKSGSQGNTWQQSQKSIISKNNYQLAFEGVLGSNRRRTIAIDDVVVLERPCPPPLTCDFEADFCEWEAESVQLTTGKDAGQPQVDHSTGTDSGKYVLFNETNGVLTSKEYNLTFGTRCLHFWFFLEGKKDDRLQVNLVESTSDGNENNIIWLEQGYESLKGEWLYAMVNLDITNPPYKVIFSSDKQNADSVIALDDLRIGDDVCPSPGSCNFEHDLCTWKNLPKPWSTGLVWLRNSGSVPSSWTGPTSDHTTGTSLGWYIFMDSNTGSSGDTAVIESEMLHYSPKACISFWYFMNGLFVGDIKVRYKVYPEGTAFDVDGIKGSQGKGWKLFKKLVSDLPMSYRIWIIGSPGFLSESGSIAIDDISIFDKSCDDPVITAEPPTKYPPTKWDCDFESGTSCSWITGNDWIIRQGRISFIDQHGPYFDHTKDTPLGRYALLDPSSNITSGDLISETIPASPNYCLMFWYHMKGTSKISLSLYAIVGGLVYGPLWIKRNSREGEWNYGSFNIQKQTNMSLVLRAKRSEPGVGDIALDDIALFQGECPVLQNMLCDFETEDICGYRTECPDYICWQRIQGRTQTKGTGPTSDHTYGTNEGHYMVVQPSQKGRNPFNNKAYLVMPKIPSTENRGGCLHFWYHMFGKDIYKLSIYIRPLQGELAYPLWSRNGQHSNSWRIGQVTVTTPFVHDIVFEAVTGHGEQGDIALDDLMLTDGECPSPGSCDFEKDLCTWMNVETKDLQWLRNQGPTPTENTGPTTDHTFENLEGTYIYLHAANPDGKRNQVGILESEFLSLASDRCLSFWVYMNGSEMGSLEVGTQSFTFMANQSKIFILWKREGHQGPEWFNIKLNLDLSNLEINEEYQIIFKGTTKGMLSDIALDDIEVTDNVCTKPPPDTFDCKEGNSIVPLSNVCDFKIDCIFSKEDEQNCGSCDFELSQCGWENFGTGSSYIWSRQQGNIDNKGGLPFEDHTTNTSLGWYMYLESKSTYGKEAVLRSPDGVRRLKLAASTCVMKFWYYIVGSNYGSLRIKKQFGASTGSLWEIPSGKEKMWYEAKVYIGRVSSEFNLEFHGRKQHSSTEVAVDDISFENCALPSASESCGENEIQCPDTKACVKKDQLCDLTDDCADGYDESFQVCKEFPPPCTFEDDSGCLWYEEHSKWSYKWSKYSSRTSRGTGESGPLNDHTKALDKVGKFLLLTASYSSTEGDKAYFYSPNYKVKKNSFCTLRFYYYMYSKFETLGPLNVYMEFENKSYSPKLLWTMDVNVGQVWERVALTVNSEKPFRFFFEGVGDKYSSTQLAIDDISLSQNCISYDGDLPPPPSTPRPTVYPCRETEFKCDVGPCIPKSSYCDFSLDCKDGSDEAGCGPCDFEKDLCGWKDKSSGLYSWARDSASSGTGPKKDHTTNSSDGHYVYVKKSSGIFLSTAKLESPLLPPASTHCEVKFWYHMYGNKEEILLLEHRYLKNQDFKSLWKKYGDQGNEWKEASVRIPSGSRDAQLRFTVNVPFKIYQTAEDLAIDDISFLNCDPKRLAANCNFDDETFNNGLCWWEHDKDSNFQWKRHSSITSSNFTGPTTDHTTGSGYYMYIDQKGRKQNDVARLISPLMSENNPDGECFSFWYHMYGRHIGYLYIEILFKGKTSIVWKRAHSQGNKWLHGEVFIQMSSDYRIAVKSSTEVGDQGDIAVDDFTLSDGLCPRVTTCDFEVDFCGWNHTYEGLTGWIRSNGSSNFTEEKPKTDHTMNTEYGHYIYHPKKRFGDLARLTSLYFNSVGERCFEMWYIMFGVDVGTLAIYQRTSDVKRLENLIPIWKKVGHHHAIWKRGMVSLKPLTSYYIAIEAQSDRGTGYTAVDDIKILSGPCSNPGACDFEKDTCGWIQDSTFSSLDWIRRTGLDQNFGSGPLVDHTTFSIQGHYMYTSFTGANKSDVAFLMSEDIEDSKEWCISFWFYMVNPKNISLSIKQLTIDVGWRPVKSIYTAEPGWISEEVDVHKIDNFDFFNIAVVATSFANQDSVTDRGIAVDDISLMAHRCGMTTTSSTVGTPLPTPTPSHFDCSFEIDMCLWHNDNPSSKYLWEIAQGHTYRNLTRPGFDHTTGAVSGHYLTLNNAATNGYVYAILISKNTLLLSQKDYCFEFWYYMYGSGSYSSLIFFLTNADDSKKTWELWTRKGNQGPSWLYEQLHLTIKTDSYLAFKSLGSQTSVSLDDFSLQEGFCPPREFCDVEQDVCNFNFDPEADFLWSVGKAADLKNGPDFDHTLRTKYGRVFFINSSENIQEGQKARIDTKLLNLDKKCLRFWYFLSGSDVGSLNVLIKYGDNSVILWSETEPESKEWHISEVNIDSVPLIPFHFVFEAVAGKKLDLGTLAIDDISIKTNCPCTGCCNFEEDLCTWSSNKNASVQWIRASGEFFRWGPDSDHTFKNAFGVYLVAQVNMLYDPRSARLDSPCFGKVENRCINFWYYMNGTKLPKLAIQSSSCIRDDVKTLLVLSLERGIGKWINAQVQVNHTESENETESYRVYFEAQFDFSNQLIALDDITVSESSCNPIIPEPPTISCDNEQTHISAEQICDFFPDCDDGTDEDTCGTACDFEKDLCQWEIKSSWNKWTRREAKTSPYPPFFDHTYLSEDMGHYIQLKTDYSSFYGIEAYIDSPLLNQASSTCTMVLWLYMTGSDSDVIEVFYRASNHLQNTRVLFLSGDQGPQWHRVAVVIGRVNTHFMVILKGKTSSSKGGIAIDDINFESCDIYRKEDHFVCSEYDFLCNNGHCISSDLMCDFNDDCSDYSEEAIMEDSNCEDYVGRCDFEYNWCGWKRDSSANYTWQRTSGNIDRYSYEDKPYRDHTSNSVYGHYLLFNFGYKAEGQFGRIISPVIIRNGKKCNFRFFYTYSTKFSSTNYHEYKGTGSLSVFSRQDELGTWNTEWSSSIPLGQYFEKATVDLSHLDDPFEVIIEASVGSDRKGYWVIDDVSFSEGCMELNITLPQMRTTTVIPTSPRPCVKDEFECGSGECIRSDQECDFVAQCKDGSDEHYCGSCAFDSDTNFQCGWKDISRGRYSWKRQKGTSSTPGPEKDKSGSGYYMYVNHNNEGLILNEAVLKSPFFQKASATCTITFSYYITNVQNHDSALKLFLVPGKDATPVLLWRHFTDEGRRWISTAVSTGFREKGWWVEFIGIHTSSKADLAIDDVIFVGCAPPEARVCKENEFKCENGACINETLKCDFSKDCPDWSDESLDECGKYPERCNFEEGFCNWSLETEDTNFQWEWFSGMTLSEDTGPARDHTYGNASGHYLYIRASEQKNGDIARISSTVFKADTSQKCLMRFWFHMYGEHISDLIVYIRRISSKELTHLLTISNSQGDQWRRQQVILYSRHDFQVVIEGVRGKGPKGDIAIDDISFTPQCVPIYMIKTTPIPTVQPPGVCEEKGLFACGDNSCINLEKVCNFMWDCPFGKDERTCPASCTFENGNWCGWYLSNDVTSSVFWNVTYTNSIKDVAVYYPLTDKTTNSSDGYYLLMWSKYSAIGSEAPAQVRSPDFSSSTSTCKFVFWYFIQEKPGKVLLSLNSTDVSSLDVWMEGLKTKAWTIFEMGLGRRRYPFFLSFSRSQNQFMRGSFAVDDLEFLDCAFPYPSSEPEKCSVTKFLCRTTNICIDVNQICDLTDDCADGSDEVNCIGENYIQVNFEDDLGIFKQGKNSIEDDLDWQENKGIFRDRLSYQTGPTFDHTLSNLNGKYISVSSGGLNMFNKKAWLLSPVFSASSTCTMRFYPYMYGKLVNQFTVYTRTTSNGNLTPLWQHDHALGDYWMRAEVVFNETRDFQIIIEGRVGPDRGDAIAIDDISFTSDCRYNNGTLPNYTTTTSTTTESSKHCEDGMFYCPDDDKCIDGKKRCDFRKDCSSGKDESGCVESTCSFENWKSCGWYIQHDPTPTENINALTNINRDDVFKWIIVQANDTFTKINKEYRPEKDHTCDCVSGWYALADGILGSGGDITSLLTPRISVTASTCTVEFWFYCGSLYCPLQLAVNDSNGFSLLWLTEYVQFSKTSEWHHARIYVGSRRDFQVYLQARRPTYTYRLAVSVDDVSFLSCAPPLPPPPGKIICGTGEAMCGNGVCINENQLCDFLNDCIDRSDESEVRCQIYHGRCSFEYGICVNSWKIEKDSDIEWNVVIPSQDENGVTPFIDHTTLSNSGKFLSVVRKIYPSNSGKKARLASYVIDGSKDEDCRVRFWYSIIGEDIVLNLLRRTSYNDDGLKLIQSIKVEDGSLAFWTKGDFLISSSTNSDPYKIVLEAVVGVKYGSVNIDDVSLTPGCEKSEEELPGQPITEVPHDCRPEKLPCDNGQCYSLVQACNFIDDCGDMTDEKDCGTSCDFENGMCGWYNSRGLKANWTLGYGKTWFYDSGPKFDHTFKNASGHYLYPGKGEWNKEDIIAHLHSKVFVISGPHCKLTFWYHMWGKNMGSLSVILKNTQLSTKAQTVWMLAGDQGNAWHQASIEINYRRQFSIMFEAKHGNGFLTNMAIDDIKYLDCDPDSPPLTCITEEWQCSSIPQCIKIWEYCDGKYDCNDKSDEYKCISQYGDCSFDDDDWLTSCDWQLLKDSNFYWSRAQKSHSNKTGPDRDQNPRQKGYYLFINSSEHELGEHAGVSTPVFKANTGNNCHLRFWYYMFGSDKMGQLQVMVNGLGGQSYMVWKKTGNQEQKWLYAHILVGSSQDYQVLFLGIVGGDNYTDIAIDEVKFTSGCKDGGIPVIPTAPTCKELEFECFSGKIQCIPIQWKCDCVFDCKDGSDEENCDISCLSTGATRSVSVSQPTVTSHPGTLPPQKNCSLGWIHCNDIEDTCIPAILLCDGVPDCPEGMDEKYGCPALPPCGEGYYFCKDKAFPPCVAENQLCDGKSDCSDSSDESLCMEECPSYFCKNNATCSIAKHKMPKCSCQEEYEGNRCSFKITKPPPESTLSDSKAWIVGIVIGILLVGSIVALVIHQYIQKMKEERKNTPQAIDNPVYGLPLDNIKSDSEIFPDQPTVSGRAAQDQNLSTEIENPVYDKQY